MLWPVVVSHTIDEDSPLYDFMPQALLTAKFEILVTVEGTTPETGNTIRVVNSYLPTEISWGQRFDQSCMKFNEERQSYEVMPSTVNKTVTSPTPMLSARQLENLQNSLKEEQEEGEEGGRAEWQWSWALKAF